MFARCAKCSSVFPTDHYGLQTCPNCQSQLMLREPGAKPPTQPARPAAQPPAAGAGPETAGAATGGPSAAEAPPTGAAAEPTAQASGAGPGPRSPPPPAAGGFPPPPRSPPPGGGGGGPPALPELPQDASTPWEERAQRGVVPALVETVKRSFVDPVGLFARMRVDTADGAVSYYWILSAFGSLVGTVWSAAFSTVGGGIAGSHMGGNPVASFFTVQTTVGIGVGRAILAPVFLFVAAGILHLFAMLFRVAHGGFNATLRSVGYAAGPAVLYVVPFCGEFVGWIWTVVLIVIGLWKTHRMPVGFAIVVLIAPGVLLACCSCATVGLAGLTGITAFNHVFAQP